MEKTLAKPSFKETMGITTIDLDDVGLTFNAQRVGPMNFLDLREADYGKGFGMPTMPELVSLVCASLENQEYESAKNVTETLRNNYLTGNTRILYTEKGMFVQDNPKVRDGFMNQKALEKKLDSYEEKGVVFSDDRSIRFVPSEFKTKNLGIMALTGGQENAEKIAEASKNYKFIPDFCEFGNINSRTKRVAVLTSGSFNDKVYVCADDPKDCDRGYSLGVRKLNKSQPDK